MTPLKFYPLTVREVRPETADCVSVLLDVPAELTDIFKFAPGQYLTFKKHMEGAELRRSYSICSSPHEGELRVAIKRVTGGRFSGYANGGLQVGEVLDVMPPMGKFGPKEKEAGIGRHYLAFASGSGITPVMSIMKAVLESEPDARFTLIYGNRNRNTIIFREAIEGLKNKYMQRLRVYHVLSRELMDVALFNGRIDAEKAVAFSTTLVDIGSVDEAFVCGPEEMLLSVRKQLTELGLPEERIHIELFSSPDAPTAAQKAWKDKHPLAEGPMSRVSIRLDGATFDLDLAYDGDNILDAALKHGADLPYACKGGVCSTCRAKITEGEIDMVVNYALEKEDVAKGFILSCQAHPRSPRVVVDFDAR